VAADQKLQEALTRVNTMCLERVIKNRTNRLPETLRKSRGIEREREECLERGLGSRKGGLFDQRGSCRSEKEERTLEKKPGNEQWGIKER